MVPCFLPYIKYLSFLLCPQVLLSDRQHIMTRGYKSPCKAAGKYERGCHRNQAIPICSSPCLQYEKVCSRSLFVQYPQLTMQVNQPAWSMQRECCLLYTSDAADE